MRCFQLDQTPHYLIEVVIADFGTVLLVVETLVAPDLVSVFGVFLMRQFMHTIPDELLDAARIDGASEFQIFFKIIIPLSKSGLSALGIFEFIAQWDSFLWPLVILQDVDKFTVPLGLAQFRGLAAFAQFGSDLDKATQQQLSRGQRMVELLKQEQYAPIPVEKQILAIYAGTQGHLDDLPVDAIRAFENALYQYTESRGAALLAEIREKKELSDALRPQLDELIASAKTEFLAARGATAAA